MAQRGRIFVDTRGFVWISGNDGGPSERPRSGDDMTCIYGGRKV